MTDDLAAQLDRLRQQMHRAADAPGPTQAEVAADKTMAQRIHTARPGIPLHHAYATLQTLRALRHLDPGQTEARLRCPRCGEDITDYAEGDHVYRTGDDRPYCSGECVIAAHRAARQDVTGVTALYEQWVKAGSPPLGTPLARWWDKRLAELHNTIQPPTPAGTEETHTTIQPDPTTEK